MLNGGSVIPIDQLVKHRPAGNLRSSLDAMSLLFQHPVDGSMRFSIRSPSLGLGLPKNQLLSQIIFTDSLSEFASMLFSDLRPSF